MLIRDLAFVLAVTLAALNNVSLLMIKRNVHEGFVWYFTFVFNALTGLFMFYELIRTA